MVSTEPRPMTAYSAYYHTLVPDPDPELTQVGPATPCGEYLRRFWHPVGLSSELRDVPQAIRILGEDLVLFRDGRGQVGLLEMHCSHRGASLEFGTCEMNGLRCCYHGWMYGVDGRVLDTPGEPPESTIQGRLYHGAYPTHEYKGLIFAYMGPPDKRPEFPILDAFDVPGYRAVPERQALTPCNWLQSAENNTDPVHLVYLHRFEELRTKLNQHRPSVDPSHTMQEYVEQGLKEWEEDVRDLRTQTRRTSIEWHETSVGMVWCWTRRVVGDLVWVRIADFIPPNIDQIPRSLPLSEETHELEFDPPRTTTWTVPVDDTNVIGFGFQYFREDGMRPSRYQFTGTSIEGRTYEERQRQPGDYEALVTQRSIAVHALEHLGWSDSGVRMVRKLVREGIDAIKRGEDPQQINLARPGAIGTNAHSTVMRVPQATTPEEDKTLLRDIGRRVLAEWQASRNGHANGVSGQ